MRKLRLREVPCQGHAGWASNPGIDARASASMLLPPCQQAEEEPGARLQRPKVWWAVWAGPPCEALRANLTPPENSELGLQTQGVLAGDSLGHSLLGRHREEYPTPTNMALKSVSDVTAAHLCT